MFPSMGNSVKIQRTVHHYPLGNVDSYFRVIDTVNMVGNVVNISWVCVNITQSSLVGNNVQWIES